MNKTKKTSKKEVKQNQNSQTKINSIQIKSEHKLAKLQRIIEKTQNRKCVVLINKNAGGGTIKRNPRLLQIIKNKLEPKFVQPKNRKESEMFSEYLSHKFETIAIVSGDGGFDSVYNGICKGNKNAKIGAIQIGRANILASSINLLKQTDSIDRRVSRACNTIRNGKTTPTNCIYLSHENRHTLCGGFGLDAEILTRANHRGGTQIWSYINPTITGILHYKGTNAKFTLYNGKNLITGEEFEKKEFHPHDKNQTEKNKVLIFSKLHKVGPINAFPEARLSDEYIYTYFANLDTSPLSIITKLIPLLLGNTNVEGIHRYCAKKIDIEGNIPFETMGDPIIGSDFRQNHTLNIQRGPELYVPLDYKIR